MADWRYNQLSLHLATFWTLITFSKTGSIPERDAADDAKLYNTSTIYSPAGKRTSLVGIGDTGL